MDLVTNDLFKQINVDQLLKMFDLFPEALVWVKDNQYRFVYANQNFITHTGLKSLAEIIGKTDHDFSPVHIAKQFIRDDAKVMAGQTINERLEININQCGEIAWYTTSKRAITNIKGAVIGSFGISRHLQKSVAALTGVEVLKEPIDYIRKNYKENFTIKELAQYSYLSVSALERRFKKYLSKTPKQFINEIRLENARRLLLETNMQISQVADNSGFFDCSYFSKQFRLFFGELPSDFRKNYRVKVKD